MNGAAYCKWKDHNHVYQNAGAYHRSGRGIMFEGKEVYLNHKTYLLGSLGANAVEMLSGTYQYDFMFQLPLKLPASLESTHGNIRYNVEAVLDVPWSFDKKSKLPFTVVRIDDLNFQPELKFPTQIEEAKQFCCLFCKSNPLMMVITIPQTGFTPGENINVKVNYNNKSDVVVKSTRIDLVRNIRYNR